MPAKPDMIIDHNAFHAAHFLMGHKFNRLLGYFFEDTETYIAAIEKGVATKDVSLIVPAAHTIKSSSFQLGAIALSKMAAIMEADAKYVLANRENPSSLGEQAELLRSLFSQSRRELEDLSQKRAQ